MKPIAGAVLLVLAAGSLNGCSGLWGKNSYFRDRGSDYLDARNSAPIRLPEGVQSKPLDTLLPVPGHVADLERHADAEVARPAVALGVELEGEFSLQRNGGQSWLHAQRIPAELWNMTRAFFEEQGFMVDEERPHVGEFSTRWRAGSQLPVAVRDQLNMARNSEIRYRVHIEPGVQRNSSEVFVQSDVRRKGKESGWSERKQTSPEASLALAGLERFYNQASQQGQTYSLLAQNHDAPRRVTYVEAENVKLLRLDSDFERAWSSVGRALAAAGYHVDDINRTEGVYFVDIKQRPNQKEPGFFKRMLGGKKTATTSNGRLYRVKLTQVEQQVFVAVERTPGAPAPYQVSQRILQRIQPHLN